MTVTFPNKIQTARPALAPVGCALKDRPVNQAPASETAGVTPPSRSAATGSAATSATPTDFVRRSEV